MKQPVNNRLIYKLSLSFFLLVLFMGSAFILLSAYFSRKHYDEITQRVNANVAEYLIEEKFANTSPFLEDGSVNKPLFGDLMHDMMAVNQAIEVYLLDDQGSVLYSVVLSHQPGEPVKHVRLTPIIEFLKNKGKTYVLGDDPLDPETPKTFSAAPYQVGGKSGFIYIILAGQQHVAATEELFSSFFLRMSVGATVLIVVFAGLIGLISIWYLTRNLREIIQQVKRFQEGDLDARIPNAHKKDLSTLAVAFNEMAETIVRNLEEVKSVDTLRRELIANISHDLRTPLAILQGYTETLEMKSESLSEDEKQRYLKTIWNSSERLSRMVSQLFEYSKLEAKQIEPIKEPFQLTELAQDVASKFEVLAKEKNIHISIDSQDPIPLVFADISLVERVIQNLMDNALKFTPDKGSISIKITAANKQVKVVVKDTGQGIPEHEQSIVFDRYRQASSSSAGSIGAGLGLAIVKKILEIHNSTISVISQPNRGTAFQFQLPVYAG